MAEQVQTPSETPNQPAVTSAAAAAPTPAAATASTPPPAQPSSEPKAAAPAAPQPTPAEAPAPTDAQAKALADAAAAKTAADAAAAVAIPADVKYEIKPPEGVQLDPGVIAALDPALRAAGVKPEQLQAIADAFLKYQVGAPQRALASDLEVTAKDPTLGGMRYGQTLKEVGVAIEAFGDPDFKKFVQAAGIANRLEFVRVFQRIGEAMLKAGDTPARGEPDAAPQLSRAERIYGKRTTP